MPKKTVNLPQAILDQATRANPPTDGAQDESPRDPRAIKRRSTRQASRVNKASVTGYFAPAVRRQLRRLAADSDTNIQALLGEALNDLFAKHGLPELIERE